MEETRKAQLLDFIKNSRIKGKGVTIMISNPNHPKYEEIYNPVENLAFKLEFYQDAYTDDLHHKHNDSIVIESWQ